MVKPKISEFDIAVVILRFIVMTMIIMGEIDMALLQIMFDHSIRCLLHNIPIKSTANNFPMIQKIIPGFNFIILIVYDNRCLHDV